MKKKTIIWLLVCTAIVIVVVIVASLKRKPLQKNEVYVAIVSSLTGDLAENGKDTGNGAKLAFDQANAVAGKNATVIHYELFDDQGDSKMAVSVANRVCQDSRFIAVVGHLTSGCMSAAAPVYNRAGIPVVMPVPTNPKITQQGYTYLFRVPPTDDDQAPFVARYLLSREKEAYVAVVNDLTAYGIGFAKAFILAFEDGGGEIILSEGIQKEARDFRSLITKIKGLEPKYVLVGATYDMGAPFVRQMRELGLEATVLAGDGLFGTEFIEQAGKAAEGTIVSFIAPDRSASLKTEEFFTKFEQRYGKVVSFAPLGYDAAKVAISAINRTESINRESLTKTIQDPNFIVEGVTGAIKFGENGDNINKNLSLYVVREQKFVLLKK